MEESWYLLSVPIDAVISPSKLGNSCFSRCFSRFTRNGCDSRYDFSLPLVFPEMPRSLPFPSSTLWAPSHIDALRLTPEPRAVPSPWYLAAALHAACSEPTHGTPHALEPFGPSAPRAVVLRASDARSLFCRPNFTLRIVQSHG